MITVMLSFWDEEPETLQLAIKGACAAGARQVVAVDGPYAHYEHVAVSSSPECYEAIDSAARGYGAKCLLYDNCAAWDGDEVAKRQFMLDLALEVAGDDGWLMICDSDYRWESQLGLGGLEMLLRRTDMADAMIVDFTDVTGADGEPVWQPARLLLRAREGLHMGTNHYTYWHANGTYSEVLCRDSDALAASTHQVRVWHLVHQRDPERRAKQVAFYDQRDTLGLETTWHHHDSLPSKATAGSRSANKTGAGILTRCHHR